jgi:hypothetical protein
MLSDEIAFVEQGIEAFEEQDANGGAGKGMFPIP